MFLRFPKKFQSHLTLALKQAPLSQRHYLLIGIDNFKSINHTFGHKIADRLLELAADRIEKIVEKEDYLFSRKNGDEFIIVLTNSSKKSATKTAKNILQNFAKPIQIDSHSLHITASIGVSCYPKDAQNKDDLFIHADIALQQAKSLGKNRLQFYSLRDALPLKNIQILRNTIPQALKNKEFFLCYQLQYDIVKNEIVGAEALLRWQHPKLGLIKPEFFIPIIENTPFIDTLSDWALTEACQQAKRWQTWKKDFLISVNISASQLTTFLGKSQNKITKGVKKALKISGLSPRYLELEITESLALDPKATARVLKKLKEQEICIACDDFGMGFSSFNRLRELPLSTIKIDKNLIKEISKDTTAYILIDAVVKIAQKLKIRLVAEGVAEQSQIDILKKLGCQFVQGYFYSKPLSAKKFENLLIASTKR